MSRGGFGFDNGTGSFYAKVKTKHHGPNINIRVGLSLEDSFHGKTIEIAVDRMERLNMEKLIEKSRRIKINIPRGVRDGHQLILKGQGHHGYNGGRDGDINLVVELKPHKLFARREHDLFARIKIPFTQALLGDSSVFKNIDGESVDFTIPPGTQQGDKIEILNKGFTVGNSEVRGNLYLIVAIDLPKTLTERQIQILESLQGELGKRDKFEPIGFESV
jgi:molecular chaperone DnaJ